MPPLSWFLLTRFSELLCPVATDEKFYLLEQRKFQIKSSNAELCITHAKTSLGPNGILQAQRAGLMPSLGCSHHL